MFTITLLNCLHVLLGTPGPWGGYKIQADEIAGIGLGAAALVGAIGYLVIRRRSTKKQ